MRSFRTLALCTVLALLALSGAPAHAQSGAPLKTIDVQVGSYPLQVSYYNEVQGGGALQFGIAPQPGGAVPGSYVVMAVPGTIVNAVPVRASVGPDPERPGGVRGSVYLPVSGQWMLSVDVIGPLGHAVEDVPILAAAPPAIPVWLGWLIGLLPVWAIVGFVIWQARRATTPRPTPATG